MDPMGNQLNYVKLPIQLAHGLQALLGRAEAVHGLADSRNPGWTIQG